MAMENSNSVSLNSIDSINALLEEEEELKKYNQPISKRFLAVFFSVLFILIVYCVYPHKSEDDENKFDYNSFYQEQTSSNENVELTPQAVQEEIQQENQIIPEPPKELTADTLVQQTIAEENSEVDTNSDETVNYDELLEELSQYPSKSEFAVNSIVSNLLKFNGYPGNILKVVISDIDQSSIKTTNDYMLANFDLLSGNLNVSKKLLYELDTKIAIAVLAHELDHFNKLAQICKSIGMDEFNRIFVNSGANNLNKEFWNYVSFYADTNDFNKNLYTDALKRFVSQKKVDRTSLYSDFYSISENIRNPLEISAYEKSDYVYNHFGISLTDGVMKRIASIFNKIDWTIYEDTQNYSMLSHERIAIFDYLFANAIMENLPEFKGVFSLCKDQKDGDLTDFWAQYKNKFDSFYKAGKMEEDTSRAILSLLNATFKIAERGISINDREKAIIYKLNTLKSNLLYQEDIDNLRKTAVDYLEYIKFEHIDNPRQELYAVLLLICIDNELYKDSSKSVFLPALKIPKELTALYNIENSLRKYSFIYNQPYFKELNVQKQDSDLLINLLEKSKLKIPLI